MFTELCERNANRSASFGCMPEQREGEFDNLLEYGIPWRPSVVNGW